MRGITMPVPDTEKWLSIAEGFKKKANFPNCIGAIDGKHIRLVQPRHSGSMYYCYKSHFSTVLLAICDANYCFTYVDVGAYGKEGDSTIFKNSKFFEKVMDNQLNIPHSSPISSSDDTPLPYVILGDEAFALSTHVMRPFPRNSLSEERKIYNYRHCRGRRFIECAFGILTNKWRIFHRPLNVNINLAEDIIKACVVLHNFVRCRDGFNFEETFHIEGLRNLREDTTSRGSRSALCVRDKFVNYFVSDEGSVPWQNSRI